MFTPQPLIPVAAVQTAYADFAGQLVGASPYHASRWDGALQCVADLYLAHYADRLDQPPRYATQNEIDAVHDMAEKRDDAQYSSQESVSGWDTFSRDPKSAFVSLHWLAQLYALAELDAKLATVPGSQVFPVPELTTATQASDGAAEQVSVGKQLKRALEMIDTARAEIARLTGLV